MRDHNITPEVADLMANVMGLAASCQSSSVHTAFRPHLGTMEVDIYPPGFDYAKTPPPGSVKHHVVWLDEDEAAGELRMIAAQITALNSEVAA